MFAEQQAFKNPECGFSRVQCSSSYVIMVTYLVLIIDLLDFGVFIIVRFNFLSSVIGIFLSMFFAFFY